MLHAFDATGSIPTLPLNVTTDLTPNASIILVDGYSAYTANANNGDRIMMSVDLEVVVDGVSYKFDYGQTTLIDKNTFLKKSLSTVSTMSSTSATSSIPGAGKSGSLPALHKSYLVGFLVGFATIMTVL